MNGVRWMHANVQRKQPACAHRPKPVTYSWEDEAAAKEYIDAQTERNRQVAAIKAQQASAILQYNGVKDPAQLAALEQLKREQEQLQQQQQQPGFELRSSRFVTRMISRTLPISLRLGQQTLLPIHWRHHNLVRVEANLHRQDRR